MRFAGKISLNPKAFVGWLKSDFRKAYGSRLGDDFEAAWKYVRENRPNKKD